MMTKFCVKKWKKPVCLLVLAFGIYILINPSKTHEISRIITLDKRPQTAWHYISDVNNLRNAYPNIIDIEIKSDNSKHDVWEYSADIHWLAPYIGKIPVFAEFTVKPFKGRYEIHIQAKACKYIICALSHSILSFESLIDRKDGCLFTHHGKLTVPRILSWTIADFAESEWANWMQMIKGALE